MLLKADQPVNNYWLSAVVVNNTRTGSPAGYGVLRYVGANDSALPEQPLLQPESVTPWNFTTYKEVLPASYLSPLRQQPAVPAGMHACSWQPLRLIRSGVAQLAVLGMLFRGGCDGWPQPVGRKPSYTLCNEIDLPRN